MTKSFTLTEFLESQTATRMGFDEQFNPPQIVINNIELLCVNILQPLRDAIKAPIKISSGYRCPRLNTSIGGASKSQHVTGHAADIICYKTGNAELFHRIVELDLPFDQIIDEFNFAWVHVSYDPSRSRKQILKAVKDSMQRTVYKKVNI